MTHEELIERLERAEGPDRELDLQITMRVKGGDEASWLTDELGRRDFGRQWAYTASLDAAMTLLPEGWSAWEMRSRANKTFFHAELSRLDSDDCEEYAVGRAATPALALAAACLKARKP